MNLFYRKFGENSAKQVIILHGLFGSSDNWVTYGKRLAEKGYEVYIPDQRNHGRSPHSDVFNYYALTEDLFDFMDQHDIENPVIIGHSMGGKVAMMFALENPALVKKLIVVDIAPQSTGPRSVHKKIFAAMRSIDTGKIKSRAEADKLLQEYIHEERIRMFILKNLRRDEKGGFRWAININAIEDNLNFIFDSIKSSSAFTKPSLFIRGGKSDYIRRQDEKIIKELFPNSKIVTIEGASHWVHAEAPDKFFEITYDFLEKP